jgi:hypothetical protein
VITNQLETLSSQGGNQFAKADAGLRRYRMVIGIYADNSVEPGRLDDGAIGIYADNSVEPGRLDDGAR